MGDLSVLLTTEGTYPFHRGGVSTWCHALTQNLPEIDFTLLAVTMHPFLEQQYELSSNVRHVLTVPLWGLNQPAEYSWHHPVSQVLSQKWETNEKSVSAAFLPIYKKFLYGILSNEVNPSQLGLEMVAMHEYFQHYDYARSMRAQCVWKSFAKIVNECWSGQYPGQSEPSLAEITEASRLLYHFFITLHYPVPRTDVTHSAAAAFCGIPCIISKVQHGTPYLLTEHGVYVREQYLNLRRYVSSFFVRWFLYKLIGAVARINYFYADQVSPVCAYNTRWERWWGVDAGKIKVIYNGVDPERFRPTKTFPNPRPVVSNVALIFPLKGQRDLIEAAAQIKQEISEVEFRLYGSPSDPDYFAECQEKVKKHNLEGTIVFSGPTNEPWQVFSQADIVAFASVSEGFPYAVIEAMLCGAAIVATDVGGVGEALADSGILVRPGHPEELAAAITRLLRSPQERVALGEKARVRALQLFTQDKFQKQYRETYRRLAGLESASLEFMPDVVA